MIISKKAIFSAILILSVSSVCEAQRLSTEEYVERYKDIAVSHMEYYGIPASITLAQGILESGSGNSLLAREANNHFGIKCHTDWKGRKYYYDDDRPQECFRVYSSAEQSFTDHAEFLSNHRQSRYDSLFVYSHDDYVHWARGLKAAGYATAPDYAERLIRIIEDNKLYLFDREEGVRLYAENKEGDSGEGMQSVSGHGAEPRVRGVSDGVDPDNYRVTVNSHRGYDVYRTNGVTYIIAKQGDTYEHISSLFRVGAKRLRKFNEVADGAGLKAGDVVFIERKRKRWEGAQLLHTVYAAEESLVEVAQNYGIQIKSLSRMNKVKPDAVYTVGRTIKLR